MDLELGRRSIVEWAEESPEPGATDFVPAQEKFAVEMPIGQGGMGEVFLVTDQDLRRQVAMKVLRKDIGAGREQNLHFVAEAQATSQLEHPGIPPVHDIGLTPDGRLYFTMKLVQGRTLREVLHDLALMRKEVAREYNLHKLVTILERICEPMHFAHERGVIHRDLKPGNVMLGDYGEVHLMDWGLARVEGASEELEDTGSVETARTAAGLETSHGAIKGTVPYMSPEQLQGGELDRRSDTYALGCLLYEMLTLHQAFDARDSTILTKKLTGEVIDVATRNPRRTVPEDLARICKKAMSSEKEQRYQTAEELAVDLRRWLDGRSDIERRRKEAEELVARGRTAAARYERLRNEVRESEEAAVAEAQRYEPFLPIAEKRSMLDARNRVRELKAALAVAFVETADLFSAALMHEASNGAARAALAELWKQRLYDAEDRGDEDAAAHALAMAERYASGPIPSEGSLTLSSDPPGAEVLLYRYEEIDGVLSPQDERSLGATPLGPIRISTGSYLCVLKKDGFRDTRYPVHITRDRDWEGEVRLRTDEEIGDGFVYVPAGRFTYGDKTCLETKSVSDFAIAKYPVTYGEYGEFLDDLDEREARERCPRMEPLGQFMERGPDGKYVPSECAIRGRARRRLRQRFGDGFARHLPVVSVNLLDAVAYCKWRARTTGDEFRLPMEEEREKASRGVDGRRFPWGDLVDASLCNNLDSRNELSQSEPVGSYPSDVSVYGMADGAGNVLDWTDSPWDSRRTSRVVRGGSWYLSIESVGCTFRAAIPPVMAFMHVGFRCAKSLSP
ncbi:MAG: protein kinase domain-containing protein [Planctomycetota bacterium]|jgi:serine/threonine-protein kinase